MVTRPVGMAAGRDAGPPRAGTGELAETFEAIVFDWDGTAVTDRAADATGLRQQVEDLCAAGVHLFVVSGTHVGNLDGQLGARPRGPGSLHICANRGSEVFVVGPQGPSLCSRRTASSEEDRQLDEAAALAAKRLEHMGLAVAVVGARMNRRKIDLIPVPEWADPKKAEIGRLAEAVTSRLAAAGVGTLADVVATTVTAAREAGLEDPRVTSDVKHVEIGLTDKADSARWAAEWLGARGITGRLVLIAGDELGAVGGMPGSDSLMQVAAFSRAVTVSVGVEPGGVPDGVVALGGGPARFAGMLGAQLARRSARRVPQIDDDPAWVVRLPVAMAQERVAESLGALANGWAGVRASLEEEGTGSFPQFQPSGVYGPDGAAVPGPTWTGVARQGGRPRHGAARLLDLRTGVLARRSRRATALRAVRFVSAADPHVMGERLEGPAARLHPEGILAPPHDGLARDSFELAIHHDHYEATTGTEGGCTALAARDTVVDQGGRRAVERLVAWTAGGDRREAARGAAEILAEGRAEGFDALLARHRSAWARLWADALVTIEGPDAAADQLAARFAVFHLLGAAHEGGEVAVGARGTTGPAYNGHVFWDAEVFVLPALAAIRPGAARAMLEYRVRRLGAARAIARSLGRRGARFPWESDGDGRDVTPRSVRGSAGETIPIETGLHEEHIVADVAWAATRYRDWTGDQGFFASGGRALVVETARYWAERVQRGEDGRGHIDEVMGPDEYHEIVDDNAYTNVMARWNLRAGADALAPTDDRAVRGPGPGAASGGEHEEGERWREIAEGLVDGWSARREVYEQFRGYFDLEPLFVADVAPPPVAIDVVLGPQRVAGSQLIKQADVLMLHHLVPDEVQAGSLETCLAFYEPRTAHGSSLSPAVHAALLARAGDPERALELFRIAARLDLDDLTRTTAWGLHLAAMGGVWRALAEGFLGLRVRGGLLEVDPHLPRDWTALEMRLAVLGVRCRVRAEHDRVALTCDAPLAVRVSGSGVHQVVPPGLVVERGSPRRPGQEGQEGRSRP